jgi:hypothetical protein
MKHIQVIVPATISNLGQLHTCAAFAIELYNTVDVIETEIGLSVIDTSTDEPIEEIFSHPAMMGIIAIFRNVGVAASGLRIHLEQNIPTAIGLHSETAFLIGGMLAANSLLENPLARDSLIEIARLHGASPACIHAALHGNLAICSEKMISTVCATVALPPLTVTTSYPDLSPSPPNPPSVGAGIGEQLLLVDGLRTGNIDLLKQLAAWPNPSNYSGHTRELFDFLSNHQKYALLSPLNSLPLVGISDKAPLVLTEEIKNRFIDVNPSSIYVVGIDRYGITISESGDISHTPLPDPVSNLKMQYKPPSSLIND